MVSTCEREIADLVAKGFTNDEVARAAFVSVNTVKTHLRRIYQRLGITSRRELRQYDHVLLPTPIRRSSMPLPKAQAIDRATHNGCEYCQFTDEVVSSV